MRGRVYGRLDIGLSPRASRTPSALAEAARREPGRRGLHEPAAAGRRDRQPVAAALGLEPRSSSTTCASSTSASSKACTLTRSPSGSRTSSRWTDAAGRSRVPGRRGVADLRARALRAVRELIGRHEGETVAAVFSHAVVIRAVLADALEMPPDALFRLGQDYGGISLVDWFGALPIVRLVNAVEPPAGRLPSPG